MQAIAVISPSPVSLFFRVLGFVTLVPLIALVPLPFLKGHTTASIGRLTKVQLACYRKSRNWMTPPIFRQRCPLSAPAVRGEDLT
jgi:hypothetical protein